MKRVFFSNRSHCPKVLLLQDRRSISAFVYWLNFRKFLLTASPCTKTSFALRGSYQHWDAWCTFEGFTNLWLFSRIWEALTFFLLQRWKIDGLRSSWLQSCARRKIGKYLFSRVYWVPPYCSKESPNRGSCFCWFPRNFAPTWTNELWFFP